ncbi:MAG: TldD/PmbA family protein [Mycobacteriales bacterium]
MSSSSLTLHVLDLVGPGAAAEVQVTTRFRALTRFARSFIHQNVVDTASLVRVRVVLDRSWAIAETDRTDPDSLRRMVESALAAARLRKPDPAFPGLAPAAPVPTGGNWDDATADATPDQRAAVVREFVDAAGGEETAGYVESSRTEAAYANSLGQSAAGRATAVAADGIVRIHGAAGVARRAGVRLADLSGAALGATALAKARAGADPVDLPPGDYEVVLEPSCVADVLGFLTTHGLNGRPVSEGRSFARVGEAQFDPAVSVWDDCLDEWSTSLPWDAEGTPRRRVDLVTAGTTTAVAHDRRTAAALGTSSTGHAVEGGERWGPEPPQLRLGAGPGGDGTALAAGMGRGLLVSDFWYTRVLDPRTVVVTGLTRNGVWLVEGGEVSRAVGTLRFTQSYPDALGPGAVLAVGSDPAPVPERAPASLTVAPSLRLARWHVTGGATG